MRSPESSKAHHPGWLAARERLKPPQPASAAPCVCHGHTPPGSAPRTGSLKVRPSRRNPPRTAPPAAAAALCSPLRLLPCPQLRQQQSTTTTA